jgi:hypothetical protein
MPMLGRLRVAGSAWIALLAFATAQGTVARAAEPQPGLWKITVKREQAGAPATENLQTRCLTADHLKRMDEPHGLTPLTLPATCKTVAFEKTANGRAWRIQCQDPTPLDATARYVFDSPQHFTAVLKMTSSLPVSTANSTTTTEAQRIGECPK